MTGTILQGAAVHAQEALWGAVALDSAQTQANAPLPPGPTYIGPVNLALGVYTGVEANNNINNSQSAPESDLIFHNGLNLGVAWPATEQSNLNFYSQLGYAKYLRYSSNDQFEVNPGSALAWEMSFEDGSLTTFDEFSDTQSVISEASVSGLSQLPRIDNTAGLSLQWTPERWVFQAEYSHDLYFSDDAAFQYLNRSTENFVLRAAHLLAEESQLGLEVSASSTAYDLPIQSNNRSYSLGPYLEWQVTPFIHGTVRGGYTIYNFDGTPSTKVSLPPPPPPTVPPGQPVPVIVIPGQPAQNLNSYYASLELTHQLTDHIFQKISVERDISLGLNVGNNFTEQITANYVVSWTATKNLGLNLSLTYEDGNQPLTIQRGLFLAPAIETENFSRVGIGPGLSYQFTQKLAGSLTYTYWDRTSNIAGNSYRDDSVMAQLNYQF